MATDTRGDTFEDVDWDEVQRGVGGVPLRSAAQTLALLTIAGAIAYDYFLVPEGRETFHAIDGFVWDVSGVDWMFLLTLLLGFFNVVLPLLKNRRMTLYYWRQFKKNKAAVVSMVYLIVIFAIGLVGPVMLSQPELNFGAVNHPPMFFEWTAPSTAPEATWEYPLGTNHQGQDMLKLMIFGMRVSMEVGLISMIIAMTIGTLVGTTAAHFGGMVDEVLMRYVDLQQTFPSFILLLLLVYLFGGSLFLIILIYGFLSWEGTARLVRSEALQRTEEEYIQAAEAAGASRAWIIRRHLIPNVSSTVITAATLLIPGFILGEAALSFLGLGDPNTYSWGKVIAGGRDALDTAPWIATIPGLFIFTTVLAFNFVGDALRDAIDPRQESS